MMAKYYRISEVAEMLNLCWNTVYFWCRDGKCPVVRVNGIYRIPIKEFKEFLEEREIKKKVVV